MDYSAKIIISKSHQNKFEFLALNPEFLIKFVKNFAVIKKLFFEFYLLYILNL